MIGRMKSARFFVALRTAYDFTRPSAKRYLFAAIGALLVLIPIAAEARTCPSGGICNPVDVDTISQFIELVLRAMVRIGGVVVALFILIAGYMFVAARGNVNKLQEARENFWYVFLGAILILGAWVIATVIEGTVVQILGR